MTPVGAVALGLALALLDLRVSGFDVLPDVVGWVVALGGLSRLVRLDPRFARTRSWSLLAALLSFADVVHPQVTRSVDGFTTTSTVAPGGLQGWLVAGYGCTVAVVAVLLSLALRDRARLVGDTPLAERFTTFAFLHAVIGAVLLAGAAVALSTTDDGVIEATGGLAGLTLVVVLAALAVEVCFLLALRGARGRPYLQDAVPPAVEPV